MIPSIRATLVIIRVGDNLLDIYYLLLVRWALPWISLRQWSGVEYHEHESTEFKINSLLTGSAFPCRPNTCLIRICLVLLVGQWCSLDSLPLKWEVLGRRTQRRCWWKTLQMRPSGELICNVAMTGTHKITWIRNRLIKCGKTLYLDIVYTNSGCLLDMNSFHGCISFHVSRNSAALHLCVETTKLASASYCPSADWFFDNSCRPL